MINFQGRQAFTYPAGEQAFRANFAADGDGFYIASRGRALAFNFDGSDASSRNITFENLPANATVWGFTRLGNGGWAVLTRQSAGANTIGTVHVFDPAGSAITTFGIANSIQAVSGETFTSPMTLTADGDVLVRVVRSVSGNMRFLRYGLNGVVVQEDITLDQAQPSTLTATAVVQKTLYLVQQNDLKVYEVNLDTFQVNTARTTTLESANTNPVAASISGDRLFIADRGGFLYRYEVPVIGGAMFFQMLFMNSMMERSLNRQQRERNRQQDQDMLATAPIEFPDYPIGTPDPVQARSNYVNPHAVPQI